jgi:hypothetical protein
VGGCSLHAQNCRALARLRAKRHLPVPPAACCRGGAAAVAHRQRPRCTRAGCSALAACCRHVRAALTAVARAGLQHDSCPCAAASQLRARHPSLHGLLAGGGCADDGQQGCTRGHGQKQRAHAPAGRGPVGWKSAGSAGSMGLPCRRLCSARSITVAKPGCCTPQRARNKEATRT